MRKGQNPAKMGLPNYLPKRLGIAILCWIPFQEGYFKQGLEILRYQIASIQLNTRDFDLIVFDNGSCLEVQDELRRMQKQGLIHFLILSDFNLGKTGALNWILSALPNEIIGFSDGDVLFRQGWFEKSLEILQAFPLAGLVSVQPCLFDILDGNGQAYHKLENDPDYRLSNIQIDPVIVEEYGRGVGLPLERIEEVKQTPVPVVEEVKTGVRAVIGQSHMQFILPREVARRIPPLPSTRGLNRQESKKINEIVDQLGLVQLTSLEAFVYHLGNQLDGPALEEIRRMDLDSILQRNIVYQSNHSRAEIQPSKNLAIKALNRLAQIPFIKRTFLRLYNFLFEFFSQE